MTALGDARMHGDDDATPVAEVSALERWRSGFVDTPPPDNRSTRRAAAIPFLLAFMGLPTAGYAFVDRNDAISVVAGRILLVLIGVLAYLMLKTSVKR